MTTNRDDPDPFVTFMFVRLRSRLHDALDRADAALNAEDDEANRAWLREVQAQLRPDLPEPPATRTP